MADQRERALQAAFEAGWLAGTKWSVRKVAGGYVATDGEIRTFYGTEEERLLRRTDKMTVLGIMFQRAK